MRGTGRGWGSARWGRRLSDNFIHCPGQPVTEGQRHDVWTHQVAHLTLPPIGLKQDGMAKFP